MCLFFCFSHADIDERLLFGTITFDSALLSNANAELNDSIELSFTGRDAASSTATNVFVRTTKSGSPDDVSGSKIIPFAIRVPNSHDTITISGTLNCDGCLFSVTSKSRRSLKQFERETSAPHELHVIVSQFYHDREDQIPSLSPLTTPQSSASQLPAIVISLCIVLVFTYFHRRHRKRTIPLLQQQDNPLPTATETITTTSTPLPVPQHAPTVRRSISTSTLSTSERDTPPIIPVTRVILKTAYSVSNGTGTLAAQVNVDGMPDILRVLESNLRTQTTEKIAVARIIQ